MPSFADSIFLFILALLLFGPKKLPVLARELGKWMGEFRRASNEFKMQMEDELRASEQADRQKQIAAMEAAAPIPPPLDEPTEPEHPHTRYDSPAAEPEPSILPQQSSSMEESRPKWANPGELTHGETVEHRHRDIMTDLGRDSDAANGKELSPSASSSIEPSTVSSQSADGVRPIPIATSGTLNMMPPATGLPTPRSSRSNALSGLLDAIPEASANGTRTAEEPESLAHGD